MSPLMLLLLSQAVAVFVVLAVLKGVADKLLIDTAIRQMTFYLSVAAEERTLPVSSSCEITVHKPLSREFSQRIQSALEKYAGTSLGLHVQQQRSILGGIIIRLGEKTFEYSLRDRLRQACHRS